ncbi:MAG: hypothetical protein H6877_10200 [Rhodobiaceae bacterium]|nr:hypothetical protein [Rhodobiaceae bacterium]
MKIIFCGDRLGDEMRANLAVRRAKGEDVRGYLSYACQEAEPADEIEFLDDVPNGERSRINTLFGVRGVNRSEPNAGKGEAIQIAAGEPPADPVLTAGKGPGGRWYVKRGKEIVTGPFETQEAAAAAAVVEVGE